MGFVGTRTALVKILAHTRNRRQWPFHPAHHVADPDRVHWFLEKVTAILAALAVEKAVLFEFDQNLFEKLDRDVFLLRQLRDLQHGPPDFLGQAQVDQRPQAVLASLRQSHGRKVYELTGQKQRDYLCVLFEYSCGRRAMRVS